MDNQKSVVFDDYSIQEQKMIQRSETTLLTQEIRPVVVFI